MIFNFANKKMSIARSTFKVLFHVNGSKEKNGIVAQFRCKLVVPKTLWNAKDNQAKSESTKARNINLALYKIKANHQALPLHIQP